MVVRGELSPRQRMNPQLKTTLIVFGALGATVLAGAVFSACGVNPDVHPAPTPHGAPQIVPCKDLPSGCPQVV